LPQAARYRQALIPRIDGEFFSFQKPFQSAGEKFLEKKKNGNENVKKSGQSGAQTGKNLPRFGLPRTDLLVAPLSA